MVGAVHAGRTRVHHALQPEAASRLEHVERAGEIDHRAAHRLLLAERREHAGQVDHAIAAGEGGFHVFLFAHVAAAPVHLRDLVGQHALDQRAGRLQVERDHIVAGLQQPLQRPCAYEAVGTGDEDLHATSIGVAEYDSWKKPCTTPGAAPISTSAASPSSPCASASTTAAS